jgi:hypothetical protein
MFDKSDPAPPRRGCPLFWDGIASFGPARCVHHPSIHRAPGGAASLTSVSSCSLSSSQGSKSPHLLDISHRTPWSPSEHRSRTVFPQPPARTQTHNAPSHTNPSSHVSSLRPVERDIRHRTPSTEHRAPPTTLLVSLIVASPLHLDGVSSISFVTHSTSWVHHIHLSQNPRSKPPFGPCQSSTCLSSTPSQPSSRDNPPRRHRPATRLAGASSTRRWTHSVYQ